jgi:hypothetical protein
MINQKCQFRLGQKVHGPSHDGHVQNDLSKMNERFFYACPKWVFFDKNF